MKKEAKKEEILQNALKVFAEYGYKKTAIEDISRSMDMAVGTIYLYAENKRDLYRSAVALGLKRWQQSVINAVSDASENGVLAKLDALITSGYYYLEKDIYLRKILEREPELLPIIESKDPFIDINRESVCVIRDILSEGVQEGIFEIENIEDTARSLFSIYIMFVQKTYIAAEGDYVKGMFNTVISLMMRGLLKDRCNIMNSAIALN